MRRCLRPLLSFLLVAAFCAAAAPCLAQPGASDASDASEAPEAAEADATPVRDGRIYDPGLRMNRPADDAPEELSRLVPWLGTWKVEMTLQLPGQEEVLQAEGVGQLSLMNRGHAVMERLRFDDFDGQGAPMATLSFFSVNANGVWMVGEGNSWTQAIRLASGEFVDGDLVVHDAMRPGGGASLVYFRRTYSSLEGGGYEMRFEMSSDRGESWHTAVTRRAVERMDGSLPVRDDIGQPAPDRPEEAAQFDFLLGEFDASHWLKRPQGEARWQSHATAVHALDGHALLEFDSFDTDPNRPDAATSILRIYNDSMRRWESLFLNNRGNNQLYFGGVLEDDRIVLHPFDAQVGSNPLSQWIFYAMQDDAYRWKGIRSTDRGRTWHPTWTIDFERRESAISSSSTSK